MQTAAIGEIDSALAGYQAALQQAATAKTLLDNLQKRLNSVRAQAEAGELEPLAVANAEAEFGVGAQNRLDALVKAQQSLGQLEDAVQSPLTCRRQRSMRRSTTFPEVQNETKTNHHRHYCGFLRRAGRLCAASDRHGAATAPEEEAATPSVVSVQTGMLKRDDLAPLCQRLWHGRTLAGHRE